MTEHRVSMVSLPPAPEETCGFFWGTHGCSISGDEPHTIHFCGDSGSFCCQYDEQAYPQHRVSFWDDATLSWGDWRSYSAGFRVLRQPSRELPREMSHEESEYIHQKSLAQYPHNAAHAAIFEQGWRAALTEERFGRTQ